MARGKKATTSTHPSTAEEDAAVKEDRRKRLAALRRQHLDTLPELLEKGNRNIQERGVDGSSRRARVPGHKEAYMEQINTAYNGHSEEPIVSPSRDFEDAACDMRSDELSGVANVALQDAATIRQLAFQSPLQTQDTGFTSQPFGYHIPTQESAFVQPVVPTPSRSGSSTMPRESGPSTMPPETEDELLEDVVDPVTGAPIYDDILLDYNTHIASIIWGDHEDAKMVKVYRRDKRVKYLIKLFKETPANTPWKVLVEGSRIAPLLTCELHHVDHTLVTAFIERWQPSTNTFNLPFGEMTITLHDVSYICGLPIDGDALDSHLDDEKIGQAIKDLWSIPDKTVDEYLSHSGIKLADIDSRMQSLIASDGDPYKIASAYLLQVLGCSMFLDKTGNRVKKAFLEFVIDHSSTGNYAWGMAVLAYLYRQLGEASRVKAVGLAGLGALLHHWISIHFPAFRGHLKPEIVDDVLPVASQAHVERTANRDETMLKLYRRALDAYTSNDVIWFPYRSIFKGWDGELGFSAYRGTIRCAWIVEPYHPDRCVRQFGHIQVRPLPPIKPVECVRTLSAHQYVLSFEETDNNWDDRAKHICKDIWALPKATTPWATDDKYLHWYVTHCHPFVLKTSYYDPILPLRPPLPVDMAQRYQHLLSLVGNICLGEHGATQAECESIYAILSDTEDVPATQRYCKSQPYD